MWHEETNNEGGDMSEAITVDQYVEQAGKHVYVAVDTSQDWRRAIPSLFRRLNVDPFDFPLTIHYIDSGSGLEVKR